MFLSLLPAVSIVRAGNASLTLSFVKEVLGLIQDNCEGNGAS